MVCVLHHLNLDFITHRYLQGMYAFGLVETNFYNEAEKYALKVEFKPPRPSYLNGVKQVFNKTAF